MNGQFCLVIAKNARNGANIRVARQEDEELGPRVSALWILEWFFRGHVLRSREGESNQQDPAGIVFAMCSHHVVGKIHFRHTYSSCNDNYHSSDMLIT
jgi:hypothetical protein